MNAVLVEGIFRDSMGGRSFQLSPYLGGYTNYLVSIDGTLTRSPDSVSNGDTFYFGPLFQFEPIPEPGVASMGLAASVLMLTIRLARRGQ
ncbi:MAG: hypothetical protein H7X97_03650 [Opitutaceae bacterium]|nr:hypothetical protein [Verrucomicrobiales bacterium]